MKSHYFQEIQGWFDFQDIYASAVGEVCDGGRLVEVGCWRGQSLSFLLVEVANSGKCLEVVGVDHFRGGIGDPDHARMIGAGADIEGECRKHCDRAGYPYRLLVEGSVRAAARFEDESLDFVFLDGSHDYGSVQADILAWLPKVKRGGILAGHDYTGAWPGVKHAVRDYFMPSELRFSGCSWSYRKVPPVGGEWIRLPSEEVDWLLYLPFVNRPDLLGEALASLGDHSSRVVVIDQSGVLVGAGLHEGPLVCWTVRPGFGQLMGWIQRDAAFRKLKYFLFMHSDARAAVGGVDRMLEKARLLDGQGPWGFILTHYDALALFNPKAVAAVGCWDYTFGWYVSDIDYYNRLKWGGWPFVALPEACASHHGSTTLASLSASEQRASAEQHEWAIRHYKHKWGCHWSEGNGRAWRVPYNGQPV